jgi:putative flippase GtrA
MTRQLPLMVRYGWVSLLCVVVNNLTLIGADCAGLPYAAGVLLSFLLCVPIGYSLHAAHTFDGLVRRGGLIIYASGMAMALPLSLATIWLFHDRLAMPMPLAAPLSSGVGLAYNFLLARRSVTGQSALPVGKLE